MINMRFNILLLFTVILLLPGFITATLFNPSRHDFPLLPNNNNKRGMGLRLPHLLRLQDSLSHHGMDKRRLGVRLPNLVRMRRLQDSTNDQLFQFQ